MAFVVSSLTAYTDKATELLRAGILFSEDFARFSVQTDINYKKYLNYVAAQPYVQAGACSLAQSGSTTLTEKEITVATYAFRQSYCLQDLVQKAVPQSHSTLKGEWATPLEVSMTDGIVEKIKEKVDTDLWLGSGADLIDGWFTVLSGCSGAISLDTYTAVTATVDNIDEIVNDFIDNITNAMWSRGTLTLHVSIPVYNLYKRNRLAANYYRDQNAGFGPFEMQIFGYENQITIKGESGLGTSNYMMLTWDKNLYMGTDEVSEISEAKWVYDEITNLVWFQSSFKLGAQIAFCGEVIHNMY